MHCGKCNHDLAECVCPDLQERLNSIFASPFLHISPQQKQRYQANADAQKARREQEQERTE